VADGHVGRELVLGPETVPVLVTPLKEAELAFSTGRRILGQREAEPRVVGGQLGPERQGEILGDLVTPDSPVTVAIKMERRRPERFRVQGNVTAPSLH